MKRGSKWLIAISGVAISVLLFHLFAFTSYYIPSAGMENTLIQSECIVVNKWSYGLRLPFMSLFSYIRLRERGVEKGDVTVFNNPANILQPVIDRREVFIGRCGGIPGDTLSVDSLFTVILSTDRQVNPDEKALYSYPKHKEQALSAHFHSLSIADNKLMGQDGDNYVRSLSRYEYYLLQQAIIKNDSLWIVPFTARNSGNARTLIIPKKGQTVKIEPWNAMLFGNTIVLHEKKQAEVVNNTLYIEGAPIREYTFSQDYYWMVSDNSVNLADSRLFGLVPQSHIIGKAFLIWFSKERGTSVFEGYRWNRFFKNVQ
ncbi:Signal peptidase I [termite gut metagenome]|uniref:Signal peptidase I n=1 Tax=termite gut metagenome TaxID=433724 RepID=A0A5J4S3B0_9ZZZZ